jgi:hypothetical protein
MICPQRESANCFFSRADACGKPLTPALSQTVCGKPLAPALSQTVCGKPLTPALSQRERGWN